MEKTAIRNFAVWARTKLKNDIRIRAGFMGITERGIADPLAASTSDIQYFDVLSSEPVKIQGIEIQMRKRIVARLEQHAKESGYQTAYESLIENMASEWFNRLIAIRYMEINEYFPDQMRMLSSVSAGKQDPDIVSNPFDSDLSFTEEERGQINNWIDTNENDKLFRLLLLKRCNQLAECLPGLFEEKNDASEFFLHLSFIEKDGVIYHLVHDIPEEAWKDQVQVIGWMYQYYNSELKDETFSSLKKTKTKVKKEQIAPVTQLFTPDWIVRYMVENSVGRLWLEGHPNENLRNSWKYYLEEAEQEPEVKEKLEEIRSEYRALSPKDLTFIDPCSGSGHILVYAFDVLIQIYESQGYTRREAAQSILQYNLYGIDIDERAYQLTYFALMMKAREYDRRILTRGIRPNVYCIEESNGISRNQLQYFGMHLSDPERNKAVQQMNVLLDVFHDAKEYGSILDVPKFDFDLLRRFVNDLGTDNAQINLEMVGIDDTKELVEKMIDQGVVLSNKYWVTCTNPPYMAVANGSYKMQEFVKENYPDSKTDMFAVFIERCAKLLCKNGFQAMITMHSWMFIGSYESLREKIYRNAIISLVHLGIKAFEEIGNDIVQTCSFIIQNFDEPDYNSTFVRLVDCKDSKKKEIEYLAGNYRSVSRIRRLKSIPGIPFAYWVSDSFIHNFNSGSSIEKYGKFTGSQNITGNNDQYLRYFWEVNGNNLDKRWHFYAKGGDYRQYYGNLDLVVDWSNSALDFYRTNKTSNLLNEEYWFKEGITYSAITSRGTGFRYLPNGCIFDKGGPSINVNQNLYEILALLNSNVAKYYFWVFNPSINLQVKDVKNFPIIFPEDNKELYQSSLNNTQLCQEDWDSFENSWGFKRHPLVGNFETLEAAFISWKNVCDKRFLQLKEEEIRINQTFIDLYNLNGEVESDVEERDVTVRLADCRRDIKSLLSYIVGCMFGRYSLDLDGLVYAGGAWDESKYTTFIPDTDNVIPITDQKYMDDDIVERLCEFLRAVYGENSLESNLDFIATALDGKGSTSREVIRNYFLSDFFKDHCKTYQKRPIYWLFDSGKQNGFKALVYMHRWNKNTIGRVLMYLRKIQEKYEIEARAIDMLIGHMKDKRQEAAEEKRRDHLLKQIAEIKEYDERLDHMANESIDIDLDDGVKVNYEKVQIDRLSVKYPILAPIK